MDIYSYPEKEVPEYIIGAERGRIDPFCRR